MTKHYFTLFYNQTEYHEKWESKPYHKRIYKKSSINAFLLYTSFEIKNFMFSLSFLFCMIIVLNFIYAFSCLFLENQVQCVESVLSFSVG